MPWGRETKWRQGLILDSENLHALGHAEQGTESIGIAISHDCDIANDSLESEPAVEFVIGNIIEEPNGHYTFAKNPRILHIPIEVTENTQQLELHAPNKVTINKEHLAEFEPSRIHIVDRRALTVLKTWLALRYDRHSLPNSLVERLRPVLNLLQKIGKKDALSLIGYWLDYTPFETELPPEEAYELWLNIVYAADEEKAEAVATKAAAQVNDKFHELIDNNKEAGNVELVHCKALSDEEFTMFDMRENIEYNIDHISLKVDPPGPLPTK
ncbi:MAG: hypothetical protein KZQ82_14820 [Candidatus Thiodiazotropha sp. (ex Lucinoma annulata)]|nr:hypothetical protein [Candidatus Thiodiazotropha sp. (ex Lucinoma annulata)]